MRQRLLVLAAIVSVRCAGPDTDSDTQIDDDPISLTAQITAAVGGELELGDGAVLSIPPGALASDAEVTFSRLTCTGIYAHPSFAGCLYLVDAGAVAWNGRYQFALPCRSVSAPSLLVQQGYDGLRPLVDTTAEGEDLHGSGSRSARYTSRFPTENPPDERCTDAPFEPCGGAVEGTWKLVQGCGTIKQQTGIYWEGPGHYDACEEHEALVDYPFTVNGTLGFETDGTYWTSSSSLIQRHELVATSCLETVGETCHPDCAVEEDVCRCVWTEAQSDGGGSGEWAYGTAGVVAMYQIEQRYCVQGNTLAIEHVDGDGGTYLSFYERKDQ